MNRAEDPIGVFDSGVGGIGTLRVMKEILPHEEFIYFGDTANAPYGTKPSSVVMACIRNVVRELTDRNVKAIVIACNTATSVAAATLREELDIPVIGMEPALKPAALSRKDGNILVMATPMTLSLPKFQKLMDVYGEGAIPVPCPGLMDLVEAQNWTGCKAYLQDLFNRYDMDRVDGIVLGCTHYVFLRNMIETMLENRIPVHDGNLGTSRQLKRVLEERGLLKQEGTGKTVLMSSGGEECVEIMRHLLTLPHMPDHA